MKYKSTRNSGSQEFTFEEALLRGYAPDGGLFVPISLPAIKAECLRSWSKLTYPELAYTVLVGAIMMRHLFCFRSVTGIGISSHASLHFLVLYYLQRMFISSSEINDQHLQDLCNKSYVKEEFDDASGMIPVKKLGSAFIAELFHGPTFCFKDFG
jgi:threonine synthase